MMWKWNTDAARRIVAPALTAARKCSILPAPPEATISAEVASATGADAIEWAKRADGFGTAVILPTSKAGDGAQTGYDLPVIRAMKEATGAQIVASGGAGKLEHFYEAVEAGATILLAASVFHFHMIDIPELRDYLQGRGVVLR